MRKGLRVLLGERRGDEGRAKGVGDGERARWPLALMTDGRECARVMGGAVRVLEALWERKCTCEYGDRFRSGGCCAESAFVVASGCVCTAAALRFCSMAGVDEEERGGWRARVRPRAGC